MKKLKYNIKEAWRMFNAAMTLNLRKRPVEAIFTWMMLIVTLYIGVALFLC